jgi:hypothetical protein
MDLQHHDVVAVGDFESFAGRMERDDHEIHAMIGKIGGLPTAPARDY